MKSLDSCLWWKGCLEYGDDELRDDVDELLDDGEISPWLAWV